MNLSSLSWSLTSPPLCHAGSRCEVPGSPLSLRGQFESKLYFVRIYYLIINAGYRLTGRVEEVQCLGGEVCY